MIYIIYEVTPWMSISTVYRKCKIIIDNEMKIVNEIIPIECLKRWKLCSLICIEEH